MYRFLVWHVLIVSISCELFKEESGYVVDYAPTYHNYKPRDYNFNYAVSDPHTGDHKSQWETKTDGVVRGGYSLLEPDGTTRIVEYIADDDGFRAVVNKVGTAIHSQAVPHEVVPLAHKSYDGQITNYAPSSEYYLGENLGSVAPVSQIHAIGTTGVAPQSHNNVVIKQTPVPTHTYTDDAIHGQNLQVVPLEEHHLRGSAAVPPSQGHGLEGVQANQLLEHNLGKFQVVHGHDFRRPEVVPFIQAAPVVQGYVNDHLGRIVLQGYDVPRAELGGHNIGQIEAVPLHQGHNLDNIQAVPNVEREFGNVGHHLDRVQLQGHNIARSEAVPLPQGHNLDNIQAVPNLERELGNVGHHFDRVQLQGHNIARSEAVPLPQGHNLANIQALPNVEHQFDNVGNNYDRVQLQGHNVARTETVPFPSSHNLGTIQAVPNVERQFGNVGHDFDRVELQGHNIARTEAVPPYHGHSLVNFEAVPNVERQILNTGHGLGRVVLQGHNLLRSDTVPRSQGHRLENLPQLQRQDFNLGQAELQGHNIATPRQLQISEGRHLGPVQAVPNSENQGVNNLRQLVFQGHDLSGTRVVPENQGQSLGQIELQGYNINRARVESAPQGHVFATGDAGGVPLQGHASQTDLNRDEVVRHSQGQDIGNSQIQYSQLIQGQVPEAVPTGPNYNTVIDFQGHGTIGDFQGQEYANRLRKDVHHSSPSRKVAKVVPSPHDKGNPPKKEFLIIYPESH